MHPPKRMSKRQRRRQRRLNDLANPISWTARRSAILGAPREYRKHSFYIPGLARLRAFFDSRNAAKARVVDALLTTPPTPCFLCGETSMPPPSGRWPGRPAYICRDCWTGWR